MSNHLKHMAFGGAVIFGALVLLGVSWATAVRYGLLLACPIMMAMMVFMNHGTGQSSSVGQHDRSSDPELTPEPGSSKRHR